MSDADLQSGDLVWVDFDPAFGHEQQGRRPALVISPASYNTRSSFTLVCPITSSQRPWPFHIPIPSGLPIAGAIIVDQIKAIDGRRIVTTAIGQIGDAMLADVRRMLAALLTGGADP